MKSLVTVRKCDDYEPNHLATVLETLLGDLGGPSSFFKRGDRVLLKPNLLTSSPPERAVVTHPAFVEAVATLVIDCGATAFIGDSPPMGRLARVLAKSGYDPFMKRLGIEAVAFAEKVSTEFTDGRLFRRIDLAREVFEFDTVVNLPKLKTHCQMVVTLAVKNLFGVIVGTDKVSWHMRAGKDSDSFATVLVQILEKVRPALSIIDGILGMQGNGPTYGEPRHIGIVAASTDAVALDAELCRLVGIPLERVRTCVIGHELGLGRSHADEIDLIGDKLPGFPLRNFKPPKSMTVMWNLSAGNPVRKFMENHVITKPDIDTTACRTCGICMEHCPPRAISEQNGLMVIDRRKCISCFCCHELCVNNAVRIVQPFLGRCLAKINR